MPTRVTIEAYLDETNKNLTTAQQADNRDSAISKFIDDLSYSREIGGRGINNVDDAFATTLVGSRRVNDSHGNYAFDTITVELPDALFPVRVGGLQHLVGLLTDGLPSKTGSLQWKNAKVVSLELSDVLRAEAEARFRTGFAHTIADIRDAFDLRPDRPLLAFSFKPRVGVQYPELEKIAGDLAAAGFNIIEFDTRRIEDPALGTNPSTVDNWMRIQEVMTRSAKGRPVAFSPNLSTRTDIAVETAMEWCKRMQPNHPTTIKVDGGLDGLSTIQAIREKIKQESPIITCFPLLRRSLSNSLGAGPDGWVDLLAMSGADIIYPGDRPSFTDDRGRIVSGDDLMNSTSRAQRRYKKFMDRGWPMPSFAAGAHAGDIHVAQNLLGGGTAMFLGEALTASNLGIKAAGELIAEIVDETAAEMSSDHPTLPTPLLARYADHFDTNTFIAYDAVFGPGRATPLRKIRP